MSTKNTKLIDHALAAWIVWLEVHLIPAERQTKKVTSQAGGWDDDRKGDTLIRDPYQHSNPVLARLIAAESAGTSWPMSIHAAIADMPRSHQIALFGRAKGRSLEASSRIAKIKPTSMAVVESLAMSRLRIHLALIEHVQRGQNHQRREDAEAKELQIKCA